MADMTRWYFNKKSGTCEEFSYGGCSGNDNNFMTKSECLSKCGRGNTTLSIQYNLIFLLLRTHRRSWC